MDVETHICHWAHCLHFKTKQEVTELYPLLATTPLELIHMNFLTIKNPKNDKDVNVLVITAHFKCYAKSMVTPNQTAKTTALAFWSHFIVDYVFPDDLLTDWGWNFESSLRKELYGLAEVKKIRATPYHPETNGQFERFNSALINMIGTLEQLDKSHWKDFLPTYVHMYNCTKSLVPTISCLAGSWGFQ